MFNYFVLVRAQKPGHLLGRNTGLAQPAMSTLSCSDGKLDVWTVNRTLSACRGKASGLPSSFMKKGAPALKTNRYYTYDRDIVCLPSDHGSSHVIHISVSVQTLCGFSSTLGMLELFRNNPTIMRPPLISSSVHYTADTMYDTFAIFFSPDSSDKKAIEEATIMLWVHFLQTLERKQSIANDNNYCASINFYCV